MVATRCNPVAAAAPAGAGCSSPTTQVATDPLPAPPNVALMADWLSNAPCNADYVVLQRLARAFGSSHPFTSAERNNGSRMVDALVRSFLSGGMCLTNMLLVHGWAKPDGCHPPDLERLLPSQLADHFGPHGWALIGLTARQLCKPVASLLRQHDLLQAM